MHEKTLLYMLTVVFFEIPLTLNKNGWNHGETVKLTPKPNVIQRYSPLSDIPGARKVGEEIPCEATSIHPLRGVHHPVKWV